MTTGRRTRRSTTRPHLFLRVGGYCAFLTREGVRLSSEASEDGYMFSVQVPRHLIAPLGKALVELDERLRYATDDQERIRNGQLRLEEA